MHTKIFENLLAERFHMENHSLTIQQLFTIPRNVGFSTNNRELTTLIETTYLKQKKTKPSNSLFMYKLESSKTA